MFFLLFVSHKLIIFLQKYNYFISFKISEWIQVEICSNKLQLAYNMNTYLNCNRHYWLVFERNSPLILIDFVRNFYDYATKSDIMSCQIYCYSDFPPLLCNQFQFLHKLNLKQRKSNIKSNNEWYVWMEGKKIIHV